MSKLVDVINGDNSDEVQEQLNMLSSLATAKIDLFKAEIEASLRSGKVADGLTVAITQIIKRHEEYRVYTSQSTDLSKKIKEVVEEIIGGDTVDGITKIVQSMVDVSIGVQEGEEMIQKDYIVTVEYPDIIRLDIALCSWKVKDENLKEKAENIICCVIYKSAVDVEKLDFDAFLSVYAPTLRAVCMDEKTNLIKDRRQLTTLLEEAKEVYTLWRGDLSVRPLMGETIMQSLLQNK